MRRRGPRGETHEPPELRRILFVPQGGRGGTGEYARCLSLAHAACGRFPDVRVVFAMKPDAPRFEDDLFERFVMPRDRRGSAVQRVAWATAPDVAIFNNLGKVPDLAAARRAGARTVYVGSVPHYRSRAFQRAMLRHMDALFLFPASDAERRLAGHEERAWRRGGRPAVHFFDSVFAPPRAERSERLLASLGLARDGYALFVPGGGGWEPNGIPCAELFVEAASLAVRRAGLPAVVVLGPLHREKPQPRPGVAVLGYLRQPELVDLIDGARVAATGGGGLLNQALALRAACVATPLHPGDQPLRVHDGHERGLLVAADPHPESLGRAVADLALDEARRTALRERLEQAGPRNDLERCLEALAPLVEAGARPCPWWLRPVRPLRR